MRIARSQLATPALPSMPPLLQPFRWKKWHRNDNIVSGIESLPQVSHQSRSVSLINSRIHPDLDSLVAQDEINIEPIPFLHEKPTTVRNFPRLESGQDFVPLGPSTRHLPLTDMINLEMDEVHTSEGEMKGIQEPIQASEPSISPSKNISSEAQNSSTGTFGPSRRTTSRRTKVSATPSTPASHQTKDSSQRHSRKSTPRSSSDYSLLSSRSRNTFGLPSPSSASFETQRKSSGSPDTVPPMPPLDHPAFRSVIDQTIRAGSQASFQFPSFSTSDDDDDRYGPRLSQSLPSLAGQSRTSPSEHKIKPAGAGTDSKTKLVKSSLEPNILPDSHSTPALHRSQHRRSQSESSSRRASAEYSAMQACSQSTMKDIPESWEARVSKEIVRISLDEQHQKVVPTSTRHHHRAGSTSQIGKARGDHVSDSRSPSLFSFTPLTYTLSLLIYCVILNTVYSQQKLSPWGPLFSFSVRPVISFYG